VECSGFDETKLFSPGFSVLRGTTITTIHGWLEDEDKILIILRHYG